MYKQGDPVTDGIKEGVEARKQRGLEIAALARIGKQNGVYLVPSVTSPAQTKYKVKYDPANPTCTCEDFAARGCRCKHIYAVQFVRQRELNPDGSMTVTESVTITKKRKTYPQDWPNYNAAQVNEKRHFQVLLCDLCKTVAEPAPAEKPTGRPQLPLPDRVFSSVSKVYSMLSTRRFIHDLQEAHAKGFISRVPHYNSVIDYLDDPALFSVLSDLIVRASLPLRDVESQFAVDSTGFAFCRFTRWYDIKYNKFTSEQQWIKTHICTGTKTNVVTAVEIHGQNEYDANQLPALVETSAKSFKMLEVSADKGYSSQDCHAAIANVGAKPFIMFKDNATGGIGGLFGKMFHYFQFKREDFLQHYHRRSNVESTVMMIKSKFGDSVRSKTEIAAKNEVLCKVLCHNICCLVSAIYELGIQPVFEIKD
jgi:transposase